MGSKDTVRETISPFNAHGPGYSQSLQKCTVKTQQAEKTSVSDDYMNDEDIAPCRETTLLSEEDQVHLAQFNPPPLERTNTDNLIHKLQRQVQQKEMLKEFVDLEHLKPLDNCQVGKAPENRGKNRYRDILPYDLTRVPLGETNGYINASYIRVPVGDEELFYISTQGPLPGTMNDFWQMVWENHSNVIAMITRDVEHGVSKCHLYWPEPPQHCIDLAQFQLQLINYQFLESFIIRLIEMMSKQTQEKRLLYHLQFTNWPDHGTPRSSKHVITFVRYMRKIHQTGPIITHCSAGVGRSGVVLCVDIMLNYIVKDMCFDIKQIVTQLRNQRCGMIQTKEQYVFCYEIALEILKAIQGAQLNTLLQ